MRRTAIVLVSMSLAAATPVFAVRAAAPVPLGAWARTLGSLATARANHSATLLAGDPCSRGSPPGYCGKVLVVGGLDASGTPLASAELYDPGSDMWSTTGSLSVGRYKHTATLLEDGTVLVAGGLGAGGVALSSAELYSPRTGAWRTTGSLATARSNHTAALLGTGMVLVAGGASMGVPQASSELYDPMRGSWSGTGSLAAARSSYTATLLGSGRVLAVGGLGTGLTPLSSTELYDPVSGTWSSAGSLAVGRDNHTATLLATGRVLVTGGDIGSPLTLTLIPDTELYDPALGAWSSCSAGPPSSTCPGTLDIARGYHTATLLSSGKVLVAGGRQGPISSRVLNNPTLTSEANTMFTVLGLSPVPQVSSLTKVSAELYDPTQGTWSLTLPLNDGRFAHTATLLTGAACQHALTAPTVTRCGEVLAAAGSQSRDIDPVNTNLLGTSELYNP